MRGEYAVLVRHVVTLGFERQLAKDAVQETMVDLFRQWSEVRDPRAWVRTTAARHAKRLKDREARQRALDTEAFIRTSSTLPGPEVGMAAKEELFIVLKALQELPEQQRSVMAWHFDGYKPSEIAHHLGVSAVTVRSNLRHARERLKPLWHETGAEGGGEK
ncbi:RNA polymerase sigma factor [Streptomyces glomeratus]|uniref:Sigma-70 family RNA polymerase sigma factor n=1 Tax=Streptomyces glomeratus TaxID=284452 RepID=A0ABP6L2F0_9ACTN|nr:sigma-70 family RNA polymerase sigma factor [Streptomyces glomeratus]MCF1511695.1 sigma-70 family RNA polymerase sigma factor [Streptomyces glomeratus]